MLGSGSLTQTHCSTFALSVLAWPGLAWPGLACLVWPVWSGLAWPVWHGLVLLGCQRLPEPPLSMAGYSDSRLRGIITYLLCQTSSSNPSQIRNTFGLFPEYCSATVFYWDDVSF